ncbi:zinc finger protein AEBP2-like [Teratosphaeria destructans]|uniref:Zinc finger protein AEBP2-like n=1 Tax=Teratosphaeria destructans TaxID=418781 RepID=A0A9W7W3E5_9PEZI|nr:zinc finger protein AEBP2-like [Teratosphaeria destructans]
MANKRAANVMDAPSSTARRHQVKRTKILSAEQRSDSSAASSTAISEDSAMQSTPSASDQPSRHSSFSSMQPSVEDDRESSLSSSSEEPSDDDDSEEEVITIGGPKKPEIGANGLVGGASDLQARIAALLPQLAAANRELEREGQNHSMEDVQDGEQHIEMDLGLGVLEEQGEDVDRSDATSDGEDEAEVPGDIPNSSNAAGRKAVCKDRSVMCKLMGRPTDRKKAGIEDLG